MRGPRAHELRRNPDVTPGEGRRCYLAILSREFIRMDGRERKQGRAAWEWPRQAGRRAPPGSSPASSRVGPQPASTLRLPAAARTSWCLSVLPRFCFALLSGPGTDSRSFWRSESQRKGRDSLMRLWNSGIAGSYGMGPSSPWFVVTRKSPGF